MKVGRLRLLWALYGVLLTAITIAGLELLCAFVVPSWPARELRPVDTHAFDTSTLDPSVAPAYNSWGLRDRERSMSKPPGIDFRALLVGDSFTEGIMVDQPIGQRIEALWSKAGRTDLEAVNLGVAATDPVHYYYRIRNVGLQLHPDAIVLHFFSGNDFVSDRLSPFRIAPLIAERPEPSWLGAVAPRLTWLIDNRLSLTELGNGNNTDELAIVNEALKKPPPARLKALVRYVEQYAYPDLDDATISEVLSRAHESFWQAFTPRTRDQEVLAGWLLRAIVGWETGKSSGPSSDAEAWRTVDRRSLEATLSWLKGAADLAHDRGVKFMIALIPPPAIDPRYMDFWAPWPRFRRFPIGKQAEHQALKEALGAQGIPFIDLADDFAGKPGAYRLSDGHWTEWGTDIAAERVARAIEALRDGRSLDEANNHHATLNAFPPL